VDFVDAPVSGGVTGAQNATLSFMIGAENPQIYQKTKNILKHMGKNFFDCKGVGMGQAAKICNNLALSI